MVKRHLIAKNPKIDPHTFKEKRRERKEGEKDKDWSQKEGRNQVNKQIHKWKWILKIRLAKLQNQNMGKMKHS